MNSPGSPIKSCVRHHFPPKNRYLPSLRRSLGWIMVVMVILSLTWVSLPPAWAGDGALDLSFNPGAGVGSSAMLWGRTNYTNYSGNMMITGNFREMGGYSRTDIARVDGDGNLDPSFNAAVSSDSYNVNACILLNPGDSNTQMLIGGEFSIPSSGGTYYGLARLYADGSVDTSFAHTFTSGEGIQTMARQADGKIVVGGFAMSVTGYPGTAFYLLRLDADGGVDTTYPMRSAPGGMIYSVLADQGAPGQVRLFGDIPRWSDPTHTHWDHFLQLKADGDTVIQRIGDEVVNGTILYMAYQGSNMVIVGAFTQVNGTTMNGIARLLPNGTLDSNFTIGSGANGHVKRVTIDGTKLVLNGYFNSFNGTACGYMVRLNNNGSVDDTTHIGTGADDRIWNVFKQDDGTWTVMGAFQSFNGAPRQGLASLTSDGYLGLNSQFASFTTDFSNSTAKIYAIQETSQGTLIAGALSRYGGKLHQRVARVRYDGSPDNSFRAGIAGTAYNMSMEMDGKILVAGRFGQGTGYVGCTSLARLNLDGTMDLGFHPVLAKADGTLPDLFLVQEAWDGSGHIYAGGDFASVNGVARSGIVRLNSNGTLDSTFTFNPASFPNLTNIMVTHMGDDTGGGFGVIGKATYNGSTCGFMARLFHDGSLDHSFATHESPVPYVVIVDGEIKAGTGEDYIILGGTFTHILDGGTNPQRNYIARFSNDGILDPTFAPAGPDGPIYAMAGQWTGYTAIKFLIGGSFTAYNEVARKNLARLNPDGSLDRSFDPGAGADDAVYAISWNWYNQRALIAGAFTTYNGVNRSRIARIFASNGKSNPALLLLLLN